MKRIRIEGDGSPMGTRITDADTGETIDPVSKVEITIDANNPSVGTAVLTFTNVFIDLTVEANAVPE